MSHEIRVPEIGENIESGDVVKVLVEVGDPVDMDQPILELETDKAVVEIPSSQKGQVLEILVHKGDTINVGQVMIVVETEDAPAGHTSETESEIESASVISRPDTGGFEEEPPKPTIEKTTSTPRPIPAPPAISLASSGLSAVDSPVRVQAAAAPAVRRLARELGVDVGTVAGSGTGGRISANDIKEHVKGVMSGSRETPTAAVDLPDFERWGPVEREPLSKIARITAHSMTASWTTIPHVTQHDRADITGLEAFRRNTAPRVAAEGGKLTVTAILLKVCAAALKAFPQFNSSLDWQAEEVIRKHYYHIGVAVDTDRGLIVPVVRDVDTKSLTQLAVELQDLAARTHDKKIRPEELEGGNFTISNLGGIGGTGFTPIVYGSQVAILGVSRTQKELQLQDGKPTERLMLPLALSYDHRVINGADGARFLRWVGEALENPYLVLLGA